MAEGQVFVMNYCRRRQLTHAFCCGDPGLREHYYDPRYSRKLPSGRFQAFAGSGKVTLTDVPFPAAPEISTWPSSRAARSFMPSNPNDLEPLRSAGRMPLPLSVTSITTLASLR